MTSRSKLIEQGARLAEQNMARGAEIGRYLIVEDPDGIEPAMIHRGPNFDTIPPENWFQEHLDRIFSRDAHA